MNITFSMSFKEGLYSKHCVLYLFSSGMRYVCTQRLNLSYTPKFYISLNYLVNRHMRTTIPSHKETHIDVTQQWQRYSWGSSLYSWSATQSRQLLTFLRLPRLDLQTEKYNMLILLSLYSSIDGFN